MNHVGLIGSGIEYSLSPVMHNAAFSDLGLAWSYRLLDTALGNLENVIQLIRREPWRGANVTIPFKQAVIPFLDSISQDAELTGAVNTIIHRGGKLHGENTDIEGFRRHLSDLGWLSEAGSALIFGAGGAARAAALALLTKGYTVTMTARTPSRADSFRNALPPALRGMVELLPWSSESSQTTFAPARIIVNATPLGGYSLPLHNPLPPDFNPHPTAHLYDMTYNPPVTPFLEFGKSRGLQISSGLGMLIRQGALAFNLWTGAAPDINLMQTAAEQALEVFNASISDCR